MGKMLHLFMILSVITAILFFCMKISHKHHSCHVQLDVQAQ